MRRAFGHREGTVSTPRPPQLTENSWLCLIRVLAGHVLAEMLERYSHNGISTIELAITALDVVFEAGEGSLRFN